MAEHAARAFDHQRISTDKLLQAALLIVSQALPDDRAFAENVFKRIGAVREHRNKLLHRVWRPSRDGSSMMMVPRPGRTEAAARDLAEFQRLADELAEGTLGLTVLL